MDVQSSLPYEQCWDFSALVNTLSYRFRSSSTSLAQSQFHTAKRRTNEDVIDFANRLYVVFWLRLIQLPSSNAKELLIQQFIDSIADVTIRRHIVANNCLFLESAVDLVRSLEACEHVALKKPFSAQSHWSYFIFLFFYFFSIFILLTRRKATEALIHRVSNYPTCFRRCQDIAVR